MPHPSGWYNDRLVAKIAVNNIKKPVDATLEEIKNARDRLWLSQSRFARALGFGGNDNTVQKLSSKGKKTVKRMTVQTVQKMRAVVTEDELEKWTTHRGRSSMLKVRAFAKL